MRLLKWLMIAVLALAPLSNANAGWLPLATSTAWTPANLGTALVAWYKADVGVTCTGGCTTGNSVTGWADQSGAGNNLVVASGGTSPIFHSTGLGGKESIGFVSASVNGMATAPTDSMSNMGTGNLVSTFLLGSLTTSSGADGIIYSAAGQTGNPGANSAIILDTNATPAFTWVHAFGNGGFQAVTASTETRIGMIFDGVNATPYVNNAAGSTNALNFNWASPGTLRIGSNGSAALDGELREIVITNTALSAPDRLSLDNYLAGRQ